MTPSCGSRLSVVDYCARCGMSLDQPVRYECEDVEPEHRRGARGWRRSLQVFERLRGQEAGHSVVELITNKNPARARGRG